MPAGFQLNVAIREYNSNDQVAFKVDGQRFEGGERTLKFAIDSNYSIRITSKPHVDIRSINVAGFDLDMKKESDGDVSAVWNTTGMEVSKKGTRNSVSFLIHVANATLRRQVQSKFYPKEDSHADWGHKLTFLEWKCGVDNDAVNVVEENFR